jgi:hypothetical protein
MGVDTHVASGTRQALPLAVGDVLLGLGVAPELGHTEVNHMNNISGAGAGEADKEVVGFDVTVDEVLFVDRLDARNHLASGKADRLERETATAHVEQVFQIRTKEVDNEHVVQAFGAKVIDLRNAS